jgi:hypothetical protein
MGDSVDGSIRVVDSTGTSQGTDKKDVITYWPGAFLGGSYGGPSDNWSAGLDYADINSPSFGFRIQAFSVSGSTVQIQYVEASVYYSGGASGDSPAVFVQTSRGRINRKHRHTSLEVLAALTALGESTPTDTTTIPAIVARGGRRVGGGGRGGKARPLRNRAFIGFAPFDSATTSDPATAFVPSQIFLRSRSSPTLRHRPLIFAPWPVPSGNGDVCACPFGAVLVERRFATARVVSIEADPLVPSVDGSETTRPPLTPDASSTAAVIQSNFATAQIVAVCHCD